MNRIIITAFGLAILAGSITAQRGQRTRSLKQVVKVDLVRPSDAGTARGTVRLVSRTGPAAGEQFLLAARGLETGVAYDLYMELNQRAQHWEHVGVLVAAGQAGKVRLSADTRRGQALPLGAALAAELGGHQVQLRDGPNVVLSGTLPFFTAPRAPVRLKLKLDNQVSHSQPRAHGVLIVRWNEQSGRWRFAVRAAGLGVRSADLHVAMEDENGSGVFVQVDGLMASGAWAGRFDRRSAQGQPLPLGATVMRDLALRALEVRDASGQTILSGQVPFVE